MAFETQTIAGPDFSGSVFPGGDASFSLSVAGRERLKIGRTRCGGFAESGSLPKKLRRHSSLDNLSGSIDSAAVIPFGCEYLVERELEMVDGLAMWTVDVSAVTRGIVSAVELEPVTFAGPWKSLEFLVYGESEFRKAELSGEAVEFFRGSELVASVRLVADDGVRLEFNAGGDLWRHRACAHLTDVPGEFALSGSAESLTLTRKIFAFGPDATIEKRPWRFKNSFAWSVPGAVFPAAEGEKTLDFSNPEVPSALRIPAEGTSTLSCFTAPATRRMLRDFVRRNDGSNLCATGVMPDFCMSAAHLERPGKGTLEHFDLDDCIAFYLWSNRQLAKKGFRFRMSPAQGGLFAGSVSMANLSCYPRCFIQE